MDPGEVQNIQAFVAIPWSIKIIYGLISDNFSICGSKRKSYILIAALLQMVAYLILACLRAKNVFIASWCLFFANMSVAFSDVLVDALMCV